MPNLQFESLNDSLMRLPQVIQSIPDILRNPAANPLQASILLGMVLAVLLIVLLSVLLVIMRPEPEDEEYYYDDEYYDEAAEGAETGAEAVSEPTEPVSTRNMVMSGLTVTAIIILVAVVVLGVAGITTANNEVCTSCHSDTAHSIAKVGEDPHTSVRCVSCHESGGPVARATVNLAGRIQHVILGRNNSDLARAYGSPISSDACLRCHKTQIKGVYVDRDRGLRVEHEHSLEAGAQCVNCHALESGVVSATTVGMTPCLRCHDGKAAKAACATCHIGEPALAIRSTVSTEMASAQVPNPQCNGCHFDMTKCNACHGISMPHSIRFKQFGHARDGALDIWFNNGKTCAKCHYRGHNNCVQAGCHIYPVADGHANPGWAKQHQLTPWTTGNGQTTGCACHLWNPYDHDGLTYCEICHPVKPKNAK